MAALASRLTDILGRPVVDKTGFTGTFDLHLRFAFDGFGNPTPSAVEATDPSGLPSIFNVVRDQLGLKLESAKGMLDVQVIDSVDKPSAN
jgi:uncharacterized protein (TIGR03435 family)